MHGTDAVVMHGTDAVVMHVVGQSYQTLEPKRNKAPGSARLGKKEEISPDMAYIPTHHLSFNNIGSISHDMPTHTPTPTHPHTHTPAIFSSHLAFLIFLLSNPCHKKNTRPLSFGDEGGGMHGVL